MYFPSLAATASDPPASERVNLNWIRLTPNGRTSSATDAGTSFRLFVKSVLDALRLCVDYCARRKVLRAYCLIRVPTVVFGTLILAQPVLLIGIVASSV